MKKIYFVLTAFEGNPAGARFVTEATARLDALEEGGYLRVVGIDTENERLYFDEEADKPVEVTEPVSNRRRTRKE